MTALDAIIAELTPVIMTAFGLSAPVDPTKENFILSVPAARANFPREMAPDGDYELPLAVLEIGDFTADTGYAVDDPNTKRFRVCVHYVAQSNICSQGQANDMVFNLQYAVDNNETYTTFEPIEPGQTQSDVDSPINAMLLAKSNENVISACVLWEPGFQCEIIHT